MPRAYSARERTADAAVHVVGLLLGAAACVGLAATLPHAEAQRTVALAVYAGGLVSTLACSALYNLTSDAAPSKTLLRRLDHAAIFLMIAGTYTPLTLFAIGGAWGHWLLAGVWAVATAGAAVKLAAPRRFERLAVAMYLLLGWSVLLLLRPLVAAVPGPDLALLAAGGLLYSLGLVFHLWRVAYHDAVWHAFVLAAAGCHYLAILRMVALES